MITGIVILRNEDNSAKVKVKDYLSFRGEGDGSKSSMSSQRKVCADLIIC
jgi:hypothetical protein